METTNLKFGTDQFGKETPPQIKLIYRLLMFASFMWAMALEPRFPGLSEHVKYSVDSWLLIGNYGIYYFCNCFGIKPPDQIQRENVPPIETGGAH